MSQLFLTPADVAAFEAVLETTLPDTATILTRTQVSNNQGGYDFTFTASSTVACRVDSPRVRSSGKAEAEALRAGRIVLDQNWMIIVPSGTIVHAADRVQVGTHIYEVGMVSAHSWQIGQHLTCSKVGHLG